MKSKRYSSLVRTFRLIMILNPVIVTMAKAQDLTNLKKNKPLTVTGGLNLASTGYKVSGMASRLDPFTWTVGASLNFNFYGIFDVPLSFNYSQGNRTFGQPSYNQFGMSPRYKFITVHAGYRSMQFSNYTLSGVMFLGGGIEVAPDKALIKGSLMYGKFAKAVPYDSTKTEQYSNSLFGSQGYERWGYGGKLTIGEADQNINIIMFRAWDNVGSIPDPPASSGITPKENLVIGLSGSGKVFEHFKLTGEFTMSALTTDVRFPKRDMETFSYINNLGGLFTPRETSVNRSAYSFGAGYHGKIWNWEANYKRIDPGFQSLGTTYLTNDLADYTVKVARTFMENKINVSVNSGIQKNNLDNQLKVTNKRFVGGFNFSYSINEKLSLTGNFSNFNASTSPSSITIQDTFKYVQVTDNYTLMANYNFGDNTKRHSFSSNIMYQNVNTLNQTAILVTDNGTKLFNINVSYTITFVPVNLNITSSANYNKYIMDGATTQAYGPTICGSKSVLNKKVKLSINYSLLNNIAADSKGNWMSMLKSTASYKMGKSHNFQLTLSYMNKKTPATETTSAKTVNEFKGSFSYGYTFNK
jgi:hypothetical protein